MVVTAYTLLNYTATDTAYMINLVLVATTAGPPEGVAFSVSTRWTAASSLLIWRCHVVRRVNVGGEANL